MRWSQHNTWRPHLEKKTGISYQIRRVVWQLCHDVNFVVAQEAGVMSDNQIMTTWRHSVAVWWLSVFGPWTNNCISLSSQESLPIIAYTTRLSWSYRYPFSAVKSHHISCASSNVIEHGKCLGFADGFSIPISMHVDSVGIKWTHHTWKRETNVNLRTGHLEVLNYMFFIHNLHKLHTIPKT